MKSVAVQKLRADHDAPTRGFIEIEQRWTRSEGASTLIH
jgi:hypothetical protein